MKISEDEQKTYLENFCQNVGFLVIWKIRSKGIFIELNDHFL